MAWSCPFSQKANNYDSTAFILCKKKMKEGERYTSLMAQAHVMCDHQYWCPVTHTRRVQDTGRTCTMFVNGNK